MWILPKQLHTSDFVPDTAALRLDCTELSEICARSLFVRSKVSPARTWSAKWRRDSWTALLSGRILNPSHGQSFVTAWTSSLAVIPASHSAQPERDSAQKTLATSGLSSQTEFDFFAPDSAISRMSKDTSPSDSERSLESWNKLVIQRRGEYSARLKSVRHTSASGSSSWPTTNARDWKDSVNSVPPSVGQTRGHSLGMAVAEKNWPTTAARDYKGTSPGYLYRKDGKSRADQLAVAVTLEEQNWPTPTTAEAGKIGNQPNFGQLGLSNHPAIVGGIDRPKGEKSRYGQAAPANPSTDGSRQGWSTPTATDASAMSPEMRPSRLATGRTTEYLARQVQWATPIQGDSHLASTPEVAQKRIEEGKVTLSRQNPGKLNPRWVETLMGLPVGWVMPSCKSPVTIEQTNCASSATESSLQQPRELFEF
jgi:hypothetical protein